MISTPLLVPSFSSKGFRLESKGGQVHSEAADHIETASEFLSESMLVSAFDLYHEYIPAFSNAITDITIIDSGGYETSDAQDLSAFRYERGSTLDWTVDMYRQVIEGWPAHIPAVFVSFDKANIRESVPSQIENARTLFGPLRGKQMVTLLIKPETVDDDTVRIGTLTSVADELRAFDVIGFTEKELGNSTLQRMIAVARIRQLFNNHGISAPIHVFGSLDPIMVPLYFLAGAEIFDGLSWLRYGFDSQCRSAFYWTDHGAREIGIDRTDEFVKMMMMQTNLHVLTNLRNRMRKFLNGSDYTKFGDNGDLLKDAMDLLETHIGQEAH